VAIPEWELNLFGAEPELLRPLEHSRYARAAQSLAAAATSSRLKILHALLVGERSVMRAAVWADIPQTIAHADLVALERAGLVRRAGDDWEPSDGHVVVLLHLALAHAHLALADPAEGEERASTAKFGRERAK
jgi:DNA-binding transcriptional ArsR family regulator